MEDLFGWLNEMNVIAKVQNEIENGSFEILPTGKIRVKSRRSAGHPWHLFNGDAERDCLRWNNVYCRYYRIVPKACRHCWKVVFKARDLAELFKLVEIMKGMGLTAKCGVDRRLQYGGFGQCVGFWYGALSGGLRGGRNLFKNVKSHLEKALGREDLNLYLKRGCTEMEAMLPSDQWDNYANEFDRIEKLLDASFEIERPSKSEHELGLIQTHQNWIAWRAELGDQSYLLFTGRKPFWRSPVTYHASEHLDGEFPGLGIPKLEVVK
jgi:hypothetical protein